MTLRGRWTSVCLFVLFFHSFAFGQNINGTIAGTVTDPSGGAVAGAKVTLTNTDQNRVVRQITTGKDGDYSAPLLPIGHYSLTVEAPGFKKAVRKDITLNVNDKLTFNVPLQIGELSQQVTVQEAPIQVETQSSAQDTLVTGSQIRQLSLNNRNFVQLVTLMPGVSSGASDQVYVGVSNPSGQSNAVSYSINGARSSANNWMVDGADIVDRGSNVTLLDYPSVDALSEFKIERSTYSAEFGRSAGGQVNVVTKSGTSQFHGDAYEFNRNNAFAANNTYNNYNRVNLGSDGKAKVPPLRYNDFGWTLGGPIFIPGVYNREKNKTFFFVSQEFRRVITYSTLQAFAPSDSEKQGIFPSPVCLQYAASGACTQSTTRITNISPTAQAYLKDIFDKTPSGRASDNQLTVAARNVFNFEQELYRLDQTIGQKNTFFIRFLRDQIPTQEPYGLFGPQSGLPGVGNTSTNSPGHNWVGRLNTTISPTQLNELGVSYSYGAILSDPTGLASSLASPDIHPPLPFVSAVARIPGLSFSGVSNSGVNSYGPYRDYNRNYQIFDNATAILGPHTLRYGATWYYYQKTENAGGNNGTFTFNKNGTVPVGTSLYAQEFANFLTGQVSQFSQPSQDLKPDIRAVSWETYLQDDWRAKPNLTINLGLRYSWFGQPWDHRRELTNFDPAYYYPSQAFRITVPSGNRVPGSGNPLNGILVQDQNSPYGKKLSNQNNLNFAPRVGFAWDPFGTGKTSIRGGYGIFYDTILYGVYEQNIFANPPFVNSVSILNTSLDNPLAGQLSVSSNPLTLHGTPQTYQTPYTQQWSFDIQRELTKDFILDVAYVGTKGTHLPGIVDLNEAYPGAAYAAGLLPTTQQFTSSTENRINSVRPYLGYNAINSIETWFNSNYNALQVYAIKRFSGDSQISASYTYSKNMTDNRSDRSSAPQNTYNFHEGEYGRAQFDRTHIFSINYVYDLPFFKSQKGIVGHTLGGWEVSGITQIQSGLPYNIATSGVDPAGLGFLGASAAGPRPDWVCNPNVNAPHTYQQWFNTGCFVNVPVGQIRPGNAGRSLLNGPGLVRFDFSLFKNFAIGERVNLQLRGEAFNVFNHPNPDTFNTTLGGNGYGQINGFRDPRIIQLGAKLNF